MNNIVRNENDPTVDEIDVAAAASHSLSLNSSLKENISPKNIYISPPLPFMWAIILLLLQHMLAFCSSSKLTILRASLVKFTGTYPTFQLSESPKHPFAHSKGSLQPDGLSHLILRVLTLVSGTTFPFKHINHA